MTKSDRFSSPTPGASNALAGELEAAVRRSQSGQISVSIDDVSKTPAFKRDLAALARIRQITHARAGGR